MGEQRSLWRRMAASYVEWSPWIAGYLLAFFVIFFAGAYMEGLGNILLAPSLIGWAAALATLSASVVALRLASQSYRQQQEREKSAGLLYCATLHGLIANAVLMASDLKNEVARDNRRSKFMLDGARSIRDALLTIDIAKIYEFDQSYAKCVVQTVSKASIMCEAHVDSEIIKAMYESALDGLRKGLSEMRTKTVDAFNRKFPATE